MSSGNGSNERVAQTGPSSGSANPVANTGAPNVVEGAAQCTSKGKKLKSGVWGSMTREVLDDGRIMARCNYCKKSLGANPSAGTSHLRRHIDNCPARINASVKNFMLSGAPSDSTANELVMRNPTINLEDVRRALVMFVVGGAHSFTIVEERLFKYFLSVVCPKFEPISRKTLQRDAMSLYEDEKRVVAVELETTPGRVCFTSDNWRSEHQSEEFMCITAHWIDLNWTLHKRIIKFAALTPPFDGASLAEEVMMCLIQWKVADKVLSFTLDNASYNDTMIASLKTHITRKHSLLLGGEFFHMRCSCHIINLVVQAGLKWIDGVVIKVRNVVKHLKHSVPKQKKFYELARSTYGLGGAKQLRLDMPVRWNSTYIMLDRFLYFRDVVDSYVAKDVDLRVNRLSVEEWDKVTELHKFLKVFYDNTVKFSSSKTPTANIYFIGVWKIHYALTKALGDTTSVLGPMVGEMQEKFDKYWSEYNLVLSCAAVLDPRYKLERIEFCYERLYGDVYAKEMTEKIRSILFELFDLYKGERSSTRGATQGETWSEAVGEDDDMVAIDDDDEEYDAYLSKKRKVGDKSEVEMYLEEKNLSAKMELDILAYWRDNERRFPVLALVARDILCIPISTVPSESAFSLSKKLISPARSSLSPSTIEAVACYEDWLRARGYSNGVSKFSIQGVERDMEIMQDIREESPSRESIVLN